MKEILAKVSNKVGAISTKAKTGVMVAGMSALSTVPVWASEAGAGTSGAGIAIDFDIAQMFTFANIIIEALMPVVYITAGLGIGFLIINSLKAAFREGGFPSWGTHERGEGFSPRPFFVS